MNRNIFIYLSFGNIDSYNQAVFSIFSLCATQSFPYKVYVVTDAAQYFDTFFGTNVNIQYISVDAADIRRMRGDIDFVHRIKIASIERVMQLDEAVDRYVYIDSDTIVRRDLKKKIESISPTTSLAHTHEFAFSEMMQMPDDNLTKRLLLFINNGDIQYTLRGASFSVNGNFSSWNAGVLGIHAAQKQLLEHVYQITDSFYRKINHHAAEQFAFSYMLESQTKVITCDDEVCHYWPRVEKKIASAYFSRFFTKAFNTLSWNEKLGRVNMAINELQKAFHTHDFYLKDKAVQLFNENRFGLAYQWALKALVQKPFGDAKFIRDILYHTKRLAKNKIIAVMHRWRVGKQ